MWSVHVWSQDSCYNLCESQWCPVFARLGSPHCTGRIEPLWSQTKTWEAHAVTSSGTLEEIMRTKEQSAWRWLKGPKEAALAGVCTEVAANRSTNMELRERLGEWLQAGISIIHLNDGNKPMNNQVFVFAPPLPVSPNKCFQLQTAFLETRASEQNWRDPRAKEVLLGS